LIGFHLCAADVTVLPVGVLFVIECYNQPLPDSTSWVRL